MSNVGTYTDEQLASAVTSSTSWRGVLRALGLAGTSSSAIASVRERADRVGLAYGHFTSQRGWTDSDLREAVAAASSWDSVAQHLGVQRTTPLGRLRGHAVRLGIDVGHLAEQAPSRDDACEPSTAQLRRAGSLLAAARYVLGGAAVSWPLEPCRYDLLVHDGSGLRKVQVKTTTVRVGESWKVYLSTSGRQRRTYDPDEIDEFFIIDGELNCYIIPVAVVGGLHAIHLSSYAAYRRARAW
jgi:hypothetical protein